MHNPYVKLINYTHNPEMIIAQAARLCYSDIYVDEFEYLISEDNISKFITHLISSGHLSPLEHAAFSFLVEESRACSHQHVRHRIASYSQQSQRYISRDGFVIPPNINKEDKALDIFNTAMDIAWEQYDKLINLGIPKEDARYVLPNAAASLMVVTMNARELLHFFSLRCCNRAQWEIRSVADEMLRQVRVIAPNIFSNAGPSCLSEGKCYEGKFSCGKPRSMI